jgi:hypothetical protein
VPQTGTALPGDVPQTGTALPGDVPQTGTALPGDAHSQTPEGPGHDLSLDIQRLPPAPADPELEAALSDLDKQADLDQLTWQQTELGQRPPVPTAEPPAALPDGQAPAPAPQSSPPAAAPSDQKPATGHSEQPSSSAPGAS